MFSKIHLKCSFEFLGVLALATVILALQIALPGITYANSDGEQSASEKQWSPAQKEVWDAVQAYTKASHQRNLDEYLSFWHPDFVGWYSADDKPTTKPERAKGLRHYFDATKSIEYELEPKAIQLVVGGTSAIVHYEQRSVLEIIATGDKKPGKSYWTDYLVKENGKWLLISDHGGSVPEEKVMNERKSNRIDYIEISVTDVESAKQFYGAVFGWDFVDYGPDYASFNDGRLDGGFTKDPNSQKGGPLVVFYSDQLDSIAANIKKAGGEISKEIFEFPGGRRFHFLDPSGNELAVWSDR